MTKRKSPKPQPLPGMEADVGRHPDDFYRTPRHAILPVIPRIPFARSWLDPGCGDGAISAELLRAFPASVGVGVELNPSRAAACASALSGPRYSVVLGDFLDRSLQLPEVDLVCGNPPFEAILACWRRAIEVARCAPEPGAGGTVLFLQPARFFEGKRGKPRDRFLDEWFERMDVMYLRRRPGFRGDGRSDSNTYVWVMVGPSTSGRSIRLPHADARASVDSQLTMF